MSRETVLKNLGLPKNTANVYLALLEIKKGNIMDIAKRSGVARPAVYDNIKRLTDLGLVTEAIEGKKRFWVMADPKNLYVLLETKKQQLDRVIDQLTEAYHADEYKPKIHFYE